MDPGAIAELQRLYARKHCLDIPRPAKKRKLEAAKLVQEDQSASDDSDGSQSDQSDDQDISGASDDSFAAFDDDEEVKPYPARQADQSGEVEVVSFDERSLVVPGSGAVHGYRSFMSGKVPKAGVVTKPISKKENDSEDGSDSEDDLKKDKELQRLLRESHLLQEQGGDSLETQGKIRQKSIKNQLVANGASKEKQRKMPIGMRKGIEAAANKRESAKDKYNKDNGIVTAKAAPVIKKQKNIKTLHELNIGKYKNGKLTISRREIDRINGPKNTKSKGKKRGFRDFSNIG